MTLIQGIIKQLINMLSGGLVQTIILNNFHGDRVESVLTLV